MSVEEENSPKEVRFQEAKESYLVRIGSNRGLYSEVMRDLNALERGTASEDIENRFGELHGTDWERGDFGKLRDEIGEVFNRENPAGM